MTTFVRVAVNLPSLAGVFDYAVPDNLTNAIKAGNLVLAPFGKQKVHAVVLEFVDEPAVEYTKEIISIIDPAPVLRVEQIELAKSLSESTLSPLAAIVGLFLPPGLAQQADTLYSVSTEPTPEGELGEVQKRLWKLVQERGALRGRQIDRAMPEMEWRKAAQSLVKRGLLNSQSVLPPARVRPKFIRTAQLAVAPEVAENAMPRLGNTEATQARREKALEYLLTRPDAINVSWVYAESGCNLADLQELA